MLHQEKLKQWIGETIDAIDAHRTILHEIYKKKSYSITFETFCMCDEYHQKMFKLADSIAALSVDNSKQWHE